MFVSANNKTKTLKGCDIYFNIKNTLALIVISKYYFDTDVFSNPVQVK